MLLTAKKLVYLPPAFVCCLSNSSSLNPSSSLSSWFERVCTVIEVTNVEKMISQNYQVKRKPKNLELIFPTHAQTHALLCIPMRSPKAVEIEEKTC